MSRILPMTASLSSLNIFFSFAIIFAWCWVKDLFAKDSWEQPSSGWACSLLRYRTLGEWRSLPTALLLDLRIANHRLWTVIGSLGCLYTQLWVDVVSIFCLSVIMRVLFYFTFLVKTEPPIILSVNPISRQMFQIQWEPHESIPVYALRCTLRFRAVNSTHWVSSTITVFLLETQGTTSLAALLIWNCGFLLFTWKTGKKNSDYYTIPRLHLPFVTLAWKHILPYAFCILSTVTP